jgi:hypothetical protein
MKQEMSSERYTVASNFSIREQEERDVNRAHALKIIITFKPKMANAAMSFPISN